MAEKKRKCSWTFTAKVTPLIDPLGIMKNPKAAEGLVLVASNTKEGFGYPVSDLNRPNGRFFYITEIREPGAEVNIIDRFLMTDYRQSMDILVTEVDPEKREIRGEIVEWEDLQNFISGDEVPDNMGIKELTLSLIARKVEEGVRPKEDADISLDYMLEHSVDWETIHETVKAWKKHKGLVVRPNVFYVDAFLKKSIAAGQEGVVSQALTLLTEGKGILLSSERGLGKKILVETLAYLRNQPVYSVTFSKSMSPEVFYGTRMTDNSASEKLTEVDFENVTVSQKADAAWSIWVQAAMARGLSEEEAMAYADSLVPEDWKKAKKAVEEIERLKALAASVQIVVSDSEFKKSLEDDGMMNVEEMNLGDANMVESVFNPLLDSSRSMYFSHLGKHLKASVGGFSIMCSQNEGAKYQGTGRQNAATESRMEKIILEYPEDFTPVLRAASLGELKNHMETPVLDEVALKQAGVFYDEVHKAKKAGLISDTAMNVRGFATAISVKSRFRSKSLKQYLVTGVINHCEDEKERTLLKKKLNDTVKC